MYVAARKQRANNNVASGAWKQDTTAAARKQREDDNMAAASHMQDLKTAATKQRPDTRTATTTQRRDSKTVTMTQREDSKTATTTQREDIRTVVTTQRQDIRTVVTTQRHDNISATTQTKDTRTAATTQILDNKTPATTQISDKTPATTQISDTKTPATTQISDTKTPATTTKRPDITPAATTQKQDNEPAAALYRKDANKALTTQRDNNNNNNNTATNQQPKDNNDSTALRTSQEEEDVVARRPRTARRRTKHTTLKEASNRTTQRPIKDAVKTKRRNGKDQRTGRQQQLQQQQQQQQQQQRQRQHQQHEKQQYQQHQQQQYQQHQQQHQKQKQKQQKHQHRSSGTQPNLSTLRAQMKKDIEETYPGFQKRCYFVPPNHFNVSKREKHPHVGDCYALVPTPESNSRADESHERVLEVLTEILRSRTAFVLSGLTFEDYLNKQIPLSPGQPQNLTMPIPLPRSADLNSQYRRGEVEMLVVDKTQGILILDIKAVGDTFDDLKVDEFKAVELVRKVLEKALALMRKSKDVVLHLVSDIPATIPVTVLLVLPNLSRQMLQKTLDSYEHLRKSLKSCLMTQGPLTEACLCSDDLPRKHQSATDKHLQRMAEWWNDHYPLGPQVIDDDVYEELMGRFCGPFSTITVWTAQLPRKEIRTPGQAISETGDRFATFLLHPSHLEILDSQEPRAHLVGPPGAGKTMVLAVKGAQWAQEGGHVCVLSTEAAAPAPVALVIKEMIQKMLKDSKETIDLSHVETDAILKDSDDVEADICIRVKRLETRAKGKPICLIVDGVQEEVLAYIDQLCQQIPDSKVWTSGARPSTCPSGFVLKELSTSVRRSPAVQSLLKMTELPTDSCYKYVTRSTEMVEFPLATQGLPVKLLCHAGHGDGPILQCRECGESLAQYLQELRLGKDLEEKDVMILLADSTPLHSGLMPCQFVQALSDHNIPLDIVDDYTNSQERLAFPSAQITLTNYLYVSGLERKVVIFVPEGTASDNSVTKTCIEDNDSLEIRSAAGITRNERRNILQSNLQDFVPAERVPSSMRLNRLKDSGENSQEEERHDNVQKNAQEEHQDNKQEVGQNIAHAQKNVEKNRQEDRDKSRHKITPEIREDADTKSVQDVRSEKTQHSTEDRQDIHQNHTHEDQQRNFEEAAIITATKCHEVGDQHFPEEHTGQQVKDHRENIREEHRHDDVQKNTQEGNQDTRQSAPGSTNCNDRNKTVTHTSATPTSTLAADVTCADSLILKDLNRLESQAGHHSEYERDTEGEREDESDSEDSIINSIANSSSGYDSDEDDASELEPESSTETQYPLENTCTPFPPQSEGMDTPEVCAKAKILDHEEKRNNSLTKDCGDSCLESELSSSETVELSVHSLEDVHVHVSDIEEETDTSSRQVCDVEDEDEAPQPASCPGDADSSAIPPGDPSIFEKDCSVESLLEQKATLREGRDLGQRVMQSAESRLQAAVQSLSLANREKLWCSVSRSLAHAVVFHF